jgi:hypothetical protein
MREPDRGECMGGDDPRTTLATCVRRLMAATALVTLLAACSQATSAPSPDPTSRPASAEATASSGSGTTLAVVADFGNCGPGEARVAQMVDAWDVAAVATAGDNTYTATGCAPFTDSVGDYYGEYVDDPAGPRFFPTLGNHDYENADAGLEAYVSYFSYLSTEADPQRRWYDTRVGNIHLFMLDNDAPDADLEAQRTWLRGELTASRAEAPDEWNIVVFHKPAFTSGPHEPETSMRPDAGWDYTAWGADVVIAGHQHVYEDVVVDGLHHVTAGIGTNGLERGGCPVEPTTGSRICLEGEGAMRLVATPTSLTLEYRAPDDGEGVVKDAVTLPR